MSANYLYIKYFIVLLVFFELNLIFLFHFDAIRFEVRPNSSEIKALNLELYFIRMTQAE